MTRRKVGFYLYIYIYLEIFAGRIPPPIIVLPDPKVDRREEEEEEFEEECSQVVVVPVPAETAPPSAMNERYKQSLCLSDLNRESGEAMTASVTTAAASEAAAAAAVAAAGGGGAAVAPGVIPASAASLGSFTLGPEPMQRS